ncbi:hypothetical protein FlaCF_3244 [Flavobacterium tructae]
MVLYKSKKSIYIKLNPLSFILFLKIIIDSITAYDQRQYSKNTIVEQTKL